MQTKMEARSGEDMAKFIVQSVKTLAKTDGVADKNREDSFKFINYIISLGFKFPDNLLRSLYEIIIGVNMDEKLPEFIILEAIKTLNKLTEINYQFITDKKDKKILLAYVDRFKYFMRN